MILLKLTVLNQRELKISPPWVSTFLDAYDNTVLTGSRLIDNPNPIYYKCRCWENKNN
jgi:hypothetical protein